MPSNISGDIFKKKATASEKEMFMAQLDSYAAGQIPQHGLVESVKEPQQVS